MHPQTEYLHIMWTMTTTYALIMARLFSRQPKDINADLSKACLQFDDMVT
jgi:hypothetical protein